MGVQRLEEKLRMVTQALKEEVERRKRTEEQADEIARRQHELEEELLGVRKAQEEEQRQLEKSQKDLQSQKQGSGERSKLEARVAELQANRAALASCPLGSGAATGVPYPVDRPAVARAVGMGHPAANSMDAVSDRDFVVEALAAISLTQVHLSRLAEDVCLWASSEWRLLELGDEVSTGSSIMPQKRNPDGAELTRGKTGRVIGHLVGLLTTLKGLPMTYNRDLQEDKEAVFDAYDTVVMCLRVMTDTIARSRFRPEAVNV